MKEMSKTEETSNKIPGGRSAHFNITINVIRNGPGLEFGNKVLFHQVICHLRYRNCTFPKDGTRSTEESPGKILESKYTYHF
jgi:hypothetical protein